MPAARLIAILACLALGGCFQSSREFISAAQAEFPFQTLTYSARDEEESFTLARRGDAYQVSGEDTEVRLKTVGARSWLVQTHVVDDGQSLYLYGVAVVAADGKSFEVYKSIAEPDDRTPAVLAKYGLAVCATESDNICPSSADAYVSFVTDRIAAGDPPSDRFEILERK